MRAILIACVLLAACDVGEVPLPGDPGGSDTMPVNNGGPDANPGSATGSGSDTTPPSDNEASFQAQIKPLVTRCLNCHSGAQNPVLLSFDTLLPKYYAKPGATNILVTKADQTGGQHEGITYFNAADKATVAAWIDSLP